MAEQTKNGRPVCRQVARVEQEDCDLVDLEPVLGEIESLGNSIWEIKKLVILTIVLVGLMFIMALVLVTER